MSLSLVIQFVILSSVMAADGDLDITFGSSGIMIDDFGSGFYYGATALQPDGKIISAGGLSGAGNISTDVRVSRYLSTGTRDTLYGSNGSVTSDLLGHADVANAVVIAPDHSVIVVGSTEVTAVQTNFFIARYTTEGVLDANFGNNGRTITDFSPAGTQTNSLAVAIARQDDGKLVASGYETSTGHAIFALARYLADGTPDISFGNGGTVVTAIGAFSCVPHALLIQADGKIVAVGQAGYDQFNAEFALVRYQADGSLDPAFGNGGIVTTHFLNRSAPATCATIDGCGRLVVGGGTNTGDFAMARYADDGSLDTTFGTAGLVKTYFNAPSDGIEAIVSLADGQLVAGGSLMFQLPGSAGLSPEFTIVRYDATGGLDATFGVGGRVSTIISGFSNGPLYDLAVQPDGKILCAGTVLGTNGEELAMTRYAGSVAPFYDLAVSQPTTSSMRLTWISPGTPGVTGPSSSYDVRYSTVFITEANWSTATQVQGLGIPKDPGMVEDITVTGLVSGTTYYFAYKRIDATARLSGLSHVVSEATLATDVSAPSGITDLAVTGQTATTISLAWTAPGNDGRIGMADSYLIRYSNVPITPGSWSAASTVSDAPLPALAGTPQTCIVNGLLPATTYYFAIETVDDVPLLSPLSNVAMGQTDTSAAIASTGSPAKRRCGWGIGFAGLAFASFALARRMR